MTSVRHFVRDDQMVFGFDNHLHVVADHPRAPATGSHRAGIRVSHRQLTVWTIDRVVLAQTRLHGGQIARLGQVGRQGIGLDAGRLVQLRSEEIQPRFVAGDQYTMMATTCEAVGVGCANTG